MTESRAQCSTCKASILQATAEWTGGICMPCFQKEYFGFKPHEVTAIRNSGLWHIFVRWRQFEYRQEPPVHTDEMCNLLSHYLPVIYASITGHIRSCGTTDMSIPKKLLDELRTKLDDDAWQTYLNELEGFINTKKTRNHTTGSNATPVRPSQRAGSEADNREMSHGEKVKQEGEAPPGWRWETFASGGCILLWLTLAITMPLQELIYYLLGMAGLVYFAYSICAFGLVFGISGARQGHLTNRIIAGTVALLNGVLLYSTTHVIPPPLIISGP